MERSDSQSFTSEVATDSTVVILNIGVTSVPEQTAGEETQMNMIDRPKITLPKRGSL
jgi:hypothetical protein